MLSHKKESIFQLKKSMNQSISILIVSVLLTHSAFAQEKPSVEEGLASFYLGIMGSEGSFQILNNHAPLISALAKGDLTYSIGKDETTIIVEGGVVEVLNNTITVLAEKVLTA